MILYHGSTESIVRPDVSFSKDYLDFGRGFYLTKYREQAEKWALRKAMRKHCEPIVNIYEFDESRPYERWLRFAEYDAVWLDFICACRRGERVYEKYSIVEGNVADDDVFKTVDLYFRGIWDKERTLKELRFYRQNHQLAFIDQTVLDAALTFNGSYEVKQND